MREDFWYDSKGTGKIHGCRWVPEGETKAVVQIVHGIAEYIERYDDFANFLNKQGIMVVAKLVEKRVYPGTKEELKSTGAPPDCRAAADRRKDQRYSGKL